MALPNAAIASTAEGLEMHLPHCDRASTSTTPRSPSMPSSPLSVFSRSPSPPLDDPSALDYPSPPSTQDSSEASSPGSQSMEEKDDEPPTKRRRLSKERTTTYVNLSEDHSDESKAQIERVMRVLHKRKKIVVVAGAGISVTAGIPDFRSEKGLFASLKSEFKLKGSGKDLFDADVYRDTGSAAMFHKMVSSMSETIQAAKPTPFHHMLATLAQEKRLLRLYSQNVDELETGLEPLRTTVPLSKLENGQWPKTIQLHGGLAKMECSKCHQLLDFDRDLFEGPVPPACDECTRINTLRTEVEGRRSHGVGYYRPRMVLYGEANPDGVAIGSVANKDMRQRPDAIIVVGTTLKVPGVRRIVQEMCEIVRDHRDGVAIWLNKDPPPAGQQLKDKWDIVVTGEADEIARRAALPRWNEPVAEQEATDLDDSSIHVASRPATPQQLVYEPVPSSQHYNNSFKPPNADEEARIPADCGPIGSPLTIRKASRTISDISSDDGVTIKHGLMTPTKQPKAGASLMSIQARLKAGAAAQQNRAKLNGTNVNSKKKNQTATRKTEGVPGKRSKTKTAKKNIGSTSLNSVQNSFNVSKMAVSNLVNKENSDMWCRTPEKKATDSPKKLVTPGKPIPCFPNLSPAKRSLNVLSG